MSEKTTKPLASSVAEKLLETAFDPAAVLSDRLFAAAGSNSEKGIVYVNGTGEESRQSYRELLKEASRIAAGLKDADLKPGDHLLLQLEEAQDFIPGFWGSVLAGVIPVPVAVAPTYSHENSALLKLFNAWELLERSRILASGSAFAGLSDSERFGGGKASVLKLEQLRKTEKEFEPVSRNSEDTAVLLLTSGSTGIPKGVPLSHRNLLAMAAGTKQANDFSSEDVTLNWMALDHVGAVSFLGTMAMDLGCNQVQVPTSYILQQPLRWLDLIERHRATISWAPNFAFSLFLDRAEEVVNDSWDLSSMRFLVNAGEPVVARTAREFIRLLQKHKLPENALRPAFGMSETCSGITWSRGLTLENTTDETPFVDLGPSIPGSSMRVVDEEGNVLPEGEQGLLQLRGESVFSGYFKNPEATNESFSDGWFTTGDLASLRDGCLYITGRQKDVIIVNGANFYCHELESLVETLPGLHKTFTAACAVREKESGTDQLALFFSPEKQDLESIEKLSRQIRSILIQQAGIPPAFLIALEEHEIPKTEIGKIQRPQLRKLFEAGEFAEKMIRTGKRSGSKARIKKVRLKRDLAPAIAEIWQEILGIESVGYDDTFFELGGHSLLVVQVHLRLQELVGREIVIVELFNCPTVRALAEHFAKDFEEPEVRKEKREAEPHFSKSNGTAERDIAIIGIGLRFPGASTVEEFWEMLSEGREAISFFTEEDSIRAGVDPELARNPNHVKAAPILDEPGAFDAGFFRYNAKEARMIDPQQRVFLEVCWEAFENAGYDPLTFPGKIGLFASAGMNTYLANNLLANRKFLEEENGGRMLTVDSMNGFNMMITNDKDYLPTRVSYKLNLRGPSVNIQTACSSTLLTLHEACNSILMGDCEMALAGGVSIKLPQHAGHLYSEGMLNSPDGRCRAYDEKAEGTVFGNGAGVVLLKPLSAARADGDSIYAVVKATASNNDGAGKVGFTAPSAAGEEDVCAEALARAGVSAGSVTFVEGHGTGTPLGDPIEVNALTTAFRRDSDETGYCALGSVKTNLGHLQIASGIAGLIKTALALHHKKIPGTLHFEKPNLRIDFSKTPFFVNRELIDWKSEGPRRAGVNSLGIGGTNVHAILEEAEKIESKSSQTSSYLLPLSAKNEPALRQLAKKYSDFLKRKNDSDLSDIAFTAQVGRADFSIREAFVGKSQEELIWQLDRFSENREKLPEPLDFEKAGIAFLFTGQGSQFSGMGSELYAAEPVFRETLDRCAEILDPLLPVSLLGAIGIREAEKPVDLNETVFTQPALFAFEYSLAELLASYGIEAAAFAGHSVGEYVAACRAGVFSLEDGLRLIAARGRLMDGLPEKGSMIVTDAAADRVEKFLENDRGKLSIAAKNGPFNTTISGETEVIRVLAEELEKAGFRTRELSVSHAFHSPLMEPMLEEFRQVANEIEFSEPAERLVSNLTGRFAEEEVADPEYWVRHIREPVLFADGISALAEVGIRAFIEVGPKTALCGMAAQTLEGDSYLWLPGQRKGGESLREFHQFLAQLYRAGFPIDWAKGRSRTRARRVSLPTYPWQHEIYWIEGTDLHLSPAGSDFVKCEENRLLGKRWESPRVRETVFETAFDLEKLPYLAEHKVHGEIVVPGALYLSQLIHQAENLREKPDQKIVLSDLLFIGAMMLDAEETRTVQTVFLPEEEKEGEFRFEILSFPEKQPGESITHVTGKLEFAEIDSSQFESDDESENLMKSDPADHYSIMDSMAIDLGESFRWIRQIEKGGGISQIRLTAPESLGIREIREWHPGLVDSFLQAVVSAAEMDASQTLVPFSIEKLVFHGRTEEPVLIGKARSFGSEDGENRIRANLSLETESGKPLAEVFGFSLKPVVESSLRKRDSKSGKAEFFEIEWEPVQPFSENQKNGTRRNRLLLSDRSEICRKIRSDFEKAGEKIVEIESGDFSALESSLSKSDPNEILVGWNLGKSEVGLLDWKSLLKLVRRLAELPEEISIRLSFLTKNGWSDPAQAPLFGFVQSLAHEFPEWNPSSIDLNSENDDFSKMVSVFANRQAGDRIRLKNGELFEARLKSVKSKSEEVVVRSNGTYLITGASGDLGKKIADWLVEKGAGNLVLSGRRPLDEEFQKQLERWQSAGANVEYLQADLADPKSVENLVENAEELAPLRGVFHIAGSLHDGFLRQIETPDFVSVFDSKIRGSWNLHLATKEKALDYFVLFSSIASLLGSPGQANYAAGNAFLDSLARYRNVKNLPGLSLQWGPWGEIGMTARLDERNRRRLKERGLLELSPDAAMEAFEKALHLRGTFGIFAWDPKVYRTGLREPVSGFYSDIFETQKKLKEPEKSEPVLLTVSEIERLIRETVANVLGLSSYLEVDKEKGLFDLGVDSLMAVDIKNRLEKKLGRTLRATIAFDYPSAALMAAHLGKSEVDEKQFSKKSGIEDVEIPELSEADLAALLEEELER